MPNYRHAVLREDRIHLKRIGTDFLKLLSDNIFPRCS